MFRQDYSDVYMLTLNFRLQYTYRLCYGAAITQVPLTAGTIEGLESSKLGLIPVYLYQKCGISQRLSLQFRRPSLNTCSPTVCSEIGYATIGWHTYKPSHDTRCTSLSDGKLDSDWRKNSTYFILHLIISRTR